MIRKRLLQLTLVLGKGIEILSLTFVFSFVNKRSNLFISVIYVRICVGYFAIWRVLHGIAFIERNLSLLILFIILLFDMIGFES
jgi:hypothetical protein